MNWIPSRYQAEAKKGEGDRKHLDFMLACLLKLASARYNHRLALYPINPQSRDKVVQCFISECYHIPTSSSDVTM